MTPTQQSRRGSTMIEVTLLMPWLIFLFIAVFDFGFYGYALIAVQNSARIAAVNASRSNSRAADVQGACWAVVSELRSLPNIGDGGDCSSCANGAECQPMGNDVVGIQTQVASGPDGMPVAQVTVRYRTIDMIPVPGLMPRVWINRIVQMRI